MVRGGGKEGRRKRHANVVRLPPFPLVEVVRPTSPYVEHCVESQDNVHDTLPCARISINMKYL